MSVLRILRNVAVLVILAVGFFAAAPSATAHIPHRCYFQRYCYISGCAVGYACYTDYCCIVKR